MAGAVVGEQDRRRRAAPATTIQTSACRGVTCPRAAGASGCARRRRRCRGRSGRSRCSPRRASGRRRCAQPTREPEVARPEAAGIGGGGQRDAPAGRGSAAARCRSAGRRATGADRGGRAAGAKRSTQLPARRVGDASHLAIGAVVGHRFGLMAGCEDQALCRAGAWPGATRGPVRRIRRITCSR